MPYLKYLYCEKCGEAANLELDFLGTIEAYKKEGRKNAFVNQQTIIWDYLVYFCWRCDSKYNYTYREVERRVREYFCTLSERHEEYFENLGKQWELEEQNQKAQEEAKKKDPKPSTVVRVRDRYTHKEK